MKCKNITYLRTQKNGRLKKTIFIKVLKLKVWVECT